MNNKKEGEYYSKMVRRFRNEYGGENLQDFCIKEKVSYTKMLHCLRSDSYRKPQQHRIESKAEDPGLRPLVIESPLQSEKAGAVVKETLPSKAKKFHPTVQRADFCLTSGIRISLHDCDVRTLVSMIKEMEGALC